MAGSTRRIAGLDLLRGIAVALVLLRHACPSRIGGSGIVGVLLFFTLSGYLITGLLITEYEKSGSLRLRRFYANRLLRLYPPLLVMLFVFGVVEVVTNRLDDKAILARSLVIGATYTSDIPFHFPLTLALGHLWTLAIEEQFYLFWPLVVLYALRRGRLGLVLMISAGLALAAQWVTVAMRLHAVHTLYTLPTSWCFALVVGALAQLYARRNRTAAPIRTPLVLTAVVVLVVLCLPQLRDRVSTYVIIGPVIAMCSGVLVLYASRQVELSRWTRPLCFLGTISYAAYLWNYVFINWLSGPKAEGVPTGGEAVLASVATIAVATLSWFLLEKPLAGLRHRREQGLTAVLPPREVVSAPAG